MSVPITTKYGVRDARGHLVAYHVREDLPDGDKKVWWEQPDGTLGLQGTRLEELPLYGSERLADWPEEHPVILVEGEKSADALNSKGGFFAVGTVTGAGGTPGVVALEALQGREVVLWPDADNEGPKHMERVAELLFGVAATVRWYEWPEAPEKGDAADHPAILSGDEKALGMLLNALMCAPEWTPPPDDAEMHRNGYAPETFTAADLMALKLPPVKWAVPDIVPEGVTLLAGKPKLGKSWLTLGLAVATAIGGVALGTKRVEQGECLYLALEDNRRRLQKRFTKLLAGGTPPPGLHIALEWPRLDEGGVEALDTWLERHHDARLVVVDTLKKIRPRTSGNRSVYDVDYEALEPLIPLVAEHGVAIVVVHHTRKLSAADPLDEISGSTGLSGGVDGALILRRDRGRADAYLTVTGRDIEEEQELALRWDANTAGWCIVGNADEYRLSEERQAVIEVLRNANGPLGPKDVAEVLDKPQGAIRELLSQMAASGDVRKVGYGKYTAISPDTPDGPDTPGVSDSQGVSGVRSVSDYTGEDGEEKACIHDVPGGCHLCRKNTLSPFYDDVGGAA